MPNITSEVVQFKSYCSDTGTHTPDRLLYLNYCDVVGNNHLGQLSLLPYAGWEMNTGQNAAMLCGRDLQAGWLFLYT